MPFRVPKLGSKYPRHAKNWPKFVLKTLNVFNCLNQINEINQLGRRFVKLHIPPSPPGLIYSKKQYVVKYLVGYVSFVIT